MVLTDSNTSKLTSRLVIFIVLVFIFGGVIITAIFPTNYSLQNLTLKVNGSDAAKANKQRNMLSRKLNDAVEYSKLLQCQKNPTSSSGAFCKLSGHITDNGLANALSNCLKGRSVASFGDGPGEYKRKLTLLNQVKLYDAFDGTPGISNLTNGTVKFMDLSIEQYGLRIYDWVISIEVAEHIPRKYESIYINNLVRHARMGMILSWAVIGQGGFHHINNRSPQYVTKLMKKYCFTENVAKGALLRNASKYSWLRNNVKLYYRNQSRCPVKESDA